AKQRSTSPGNFYFGLRFILNIANLEVDSPGNENDFKKIFLSKMWKRIRSRSEAMPILLFYQ
ncbi:MAG: hypothetical protein WA097_02610, partial [Candidatus Hydromicrobium sp.]